MLGLCARTIGWTLAVLFGLYVFGSILMMINPPPPPPTPEQAAAARFAADVAAQKQLDQQRRIELMRAIEQAAYEERVRRAARGED